MVLDKLTATAVSIVVSGNTGVTPFLTLFLVGCIEKANPDLLQMEETMATLLASWPSIVLLGLATALEFVSMCVPVVDEIVDSVMTVVVPVISVIGSLSTFGLLKNNDDDDYGDDGDRRLSAASSALFVFQIILIIIGIVNALCMHLFKMLIRIIGEGWLTNILTVIESSYVVTSITIAIFIKPIAIFIAGFITLVCLYMLKRKFIDKEEDPVATTGVVEAQVIDTEAANQEYVKMPEGDKPVEGSAPLKTPVSSARASAPMS